MISFDPQPWLPNSFSQESKSDAAGRLYNIKLTEEP